jgi:2-polyprenyl-3-methyl-5-hydroxy-6-metoxy-1,4-benzoquinol methylase
MERTLSDSEKDEIAALYNRRYQKKGRDISTVGWGSVESQLLRFEMATRGLELNGKAILDIGCGLGDFITFLRKKTNTFRYTGIDIATDLVEDARSRHSGNHIKFVTGDFLETKFTEKYDLVFNSGSLNYRVLENESLARAFIAKMVDYTKDVVAVNFLSKYVDFEHPKHYHYSPEEMFSFAKTLSNHVSLFHDYALWEFTIQIRVSPIDC